MFPHLGKEALLVQMLDSQACAVEFLCLCVEWNGEVVGVCLCEIPGAGYFQHDNFLLFDTIVRRDNDFYPISVDYFCSTAVLSFKISDRKLEQPNFN
jgi:hypothetical protein